MKSSLPNRPGNDAWAKSSGWRNLARRMNIPRTDLEVSALSLGSTGLGTDIHGDDTLRLLDEYMNLGGNFLDTAHCYACWIPGMTGSSERALGEWFKSSGMRDRAVLSTKGGHPPMDIYPHAEHFLGYDSLREDLDESLERLGTDRVDLYYLHRDDGKTPVDEVIDALNQLPEARYFGASNWSIERVRAANNYAAQAKKRGFVAVQNQWSLAVPCWKITDDPTVRFITNEDAIACAEMDVMVHAYSATSNGYFAQHNDSGAFYGNVDLRYLAQTVADRHGCSSTQVALAWLRQQPGTVIPILGTTKVERLKEGFGALQVDLTAEDLAELER